MVGTGAPCAGYSSWSGSAIAGISQTFTPTQTYAGGTSTEVIVVGPYTPAGTYTLNTCMYNSYNTLGTICAQFAVNVVSDSPNPFTITPPIPSFTVKLEAGIPYSSSNVAIPTQGHLYVQTYISGVATSALQAGPGPGLRPELLVQNYTQFPYSDPSLDITGFITQACLYQGFNYYLVNEQHGQAPYYDVVFFNSNTWADALLLSCGVPQTTINTWVSILAASGRNATAYQNGPQLLRNFTTLLPIVRRPLITPAL